MGDVAGQATWTTRAEAIEDFARELADLRESVGRPSFRAMAGRSKVISHTTLHEAVHGNRLPSWATTVEFVKACGADPAAYRDRWEGAARSAGCLARAVVPSLPDPALPLVVEPLVVEPPVVEPLIGPAASPTTGRRRPRRAVTALAAAALLASAGGVAWSVAGHAETPAAAPPPVARDCPVRRANPPAAAPVHAGDRAAFVADVTLPDCSHVARGQRVDKVWRLKNAGSVPWAGYTLHRLDVPQGRDECQTIPDVPVPDTAPGGLVDVEVQVSVPPTAGFCLVRYKMVDGDGVVAFPGSRPVTFQLVVD
ncbi:NBR1-Ig-like domain-containing protein [Phycicoccus sp. Soil748]|uniref:NBR1-Ig-like domain-containing protein n=1 Tax=Intrasporangiaceae TaxID=85021 RepID=UPI0007028FE7|nr:NBR1-Ig-like domain-containing protein [Phycicoccus sp. Soil748]KRE57000.1 hypothetical protein ASG70_00725 [Phycicoccus sp. Soil748]